MNKVRHGAAMVLVLSLMAGYAGPPPMVVPEPPPPDDADMIHLRAECAAGDDIACQVVQISDEVEADMARYAAEDAAAAAAPPTLLDLFAVGVPGLLLGQRADARAGGGYRLEGEHGRYRAPGAHVEHRPSGESGRKPPKIYP
jgi:hypothetical protein